MVCGRIVRAADAERGAHARISSGVELGGYVGDKEYVTWFLSQHCSNLTITLRVTFRPRRGIEVTGQERGEIAGRGVGEEIALRLNAARRENRDCFACGVPALERWTYVGVDLALSL